MKLKIGFSAGFVGILLTIAAATALGHAALESSDPAAGATIPSPYTVTATFDDALTSNGSSIVIQAASGAQVATGTVSATDDKTMTVTLPHVTDGQYTVLWTAVTADDNGVTRGTYTFTVGAPVPAGSVAAETPAPSATGGSTSGTSGGNDLIIALVLAVVIIGGVAGFVLYRNRR